MDLIFACFPNNFTFLFPPNTYNYTSPYNLSTEHLGSLCQEIQIPFQIASQIIQPSLSIISMVDLVLLLMILLISLFGAQKEDYKWLILNWSLLNFVMVSYFGVHIVYPGIAQFLGYAPVGSIGSYIATFFVFYLNHLCNYTIFPIVFNRFLALYLPNFYDRLFKRKFILFVSILGYDLFWLGIIALSNASTSSHIGLFMGLMVSIVTMIFALAILIKIYQLMKLIDKKSSQTNTYKNMQTAAMMCLSEGFIGVLINLPSIYKHVFILTNQEFDGSSFHLFLIKFYIIIAILNEILNYYAIVFDCFITLLVLKSYRRTILNVFICPYKMYRIHWRRIPTSSDRSMFVRTTALTRT